MTREHVTAAIAGAKTGAVEEGAVGAGTGTIAFGWKGGIGTSSRRSRDDWTIGVLVQSNYGGAPDDCRRAGVEEAVAGRRRPGGAPRPGDADGSCMIIVATDAPLDARNLKRLAARAIYALARTGSTYSNGSGDYAIAFSTHRCTERDRGGRPATTARAADG